MLRDTARGAAKPRLGELTLAAVVAEIERLGGDPATTTLRVNGSFVRAGDGHWGTGREDGALYVELRHLCSEEVPW